MKKLRLPLLLLISLNSFAQYRDFHFEHLNVVSCLDESQLLFFMAKTAGGGTGLGLSLTYDMVVKGHAEAYRLTVLRGRLGVYHSDTN